MLVINPDGTYVYTPNPGFEGEDTFTYTICETLQVPALCDTATVTIQVIPNVGNITVANDDAYNGTSGNPVNGSVLDNDFDPEGNIQTVNTVAISGPTNGTIVLNADGTFLYIPNNPTFVGTDQFVYEVCDDVIPSACDRATVYITIGDLGNKILAIDDINDTFVNLPVTGDVGTNDINPDGPAGTEIFTLVTTPTNGIVVLNPDGTYTYTPTMDYVGEDTFKYQVCDGGNPIACDTAIVYIEIVNDPVIGNDPPVANADTNTTKVDIPVSGIVTPNDFDPDGDDFEVTGNTNPLNGTLVLNPDGTYVYTPNLGFEGEDTFTYTICETLQVPALCDTATVTIQVIPDTENITVANDDAYYTEVDTEIMNNVVLNDTDPEGDAFIVTSNSNPLNGAVIMGTDGAFVYTPNQGYTGTDSFIYTITDVNGAMDSATVYILIQQTPAPRIALIKTGVYNNDNGVNCSDVGETITYTFTVSNPGNVSLNSISITDPLLEAPNPIVAVAFQSGDVNADGLLDVSETWIYSAIYTIVQLDVDNDSVTNQAVVTAVDPDTTAVSDLSDDTSFLENDPTITVLPRACYVIIANDDSAGPVAGVNVEVENVINVFDNDILNGNLVIPAEVILSLITPEPNGYLELNPDGSVDLGADTPPGVYQLTYQICELAIPSNCDIAVVTITVVAPVITLEATSVCDNDTPYLSYTITLENFTIDPDVVTIEWKDLNGVVIQTDTDTPTSSIISGQEILTGRILWAGAEVDANGNPTDWPGWYFENGQWIQGDDGFQDLRPTATVTISVNPTITEVVDYPPSSPFCITSPPMIALIKEAVLLDTDSNGNCIVAVGDEIQYNFTVSNEGSSDLTNVMVTDPDAIVVGVPITLVENAIDTTSFTATHIITQADIDAGFFENQAMAVGTPLIGSNVTDLSDGDSVLEDDPTVTGICQDPSIALIKVGTFNDEDGDGCSDVGETIGYVFTVTNTGNVTLTDVNVTDGVPVSGTTIASLAPGAEDATSFTAAYTITQADIDAGEFSNQATAEGTAPDGSLVGDLSDDDSVLEDDPTITVLCQDPSIALIKVGTFNDEDGDGCADVKETISYIFRVINNGNMTISNITVNDSLVNVQGAPISLLPGEEDNTFFATYLITQADINNGSVTNQAEAIGFDPSGAQVSDLSDESSYFEDDPTITILCNNPIIALIKTGTPADENGNGCIDLGETIIYDFVVTNLGNVTLTQVIVKDEMVTIQGDPVTIFAGDSDTETFSASYIVKQDDVDAGFVSNQAIAEGIDPMGNLVDDLSDDNSNFEDDSTISVLCQNPLMSVEKTGVFNDENGNFITEVGETISYVFIVTNTGNVTLYNITLEDPLPGIIISGGSIAELTPGEVDDTTFTAEYTVTQADINAGKVINQAIATGETGDGDEVTDTSDDPNDPTDTDINGDGDPDDPTVTILPNVLGTFIIFNAVSPDGNGENDIFLIQGISEYPENSVQIFNRWGVKVFEVDGYGGSNDLENVFTGESDGRATIEQGTLLPTGTYFYVLKFNGNNPGQETYAGYLYLNR
jgi:gliding motility-associated-like protein/uncharacterized repeat protein (TIGR01451 family)